jgi:hypothetical protein
MPVEVRSSEGLAAAHDEGTDGGTRQSEWLRACWRSTRAVAWRSAALRPWRTEARLRDSWPRSVIPGPRRGWWHGSGRNAARCDQGHQPPRGANAKLGLTLEARESQRLTFELSGRHRQGAWAARPTMCTAASRPKCLAGGGPLERRVRALVLVGNLNGFESLSLVRWQLGGQRVIRQGGANDVVFSLVANLSMLHDSCVPPPNARRRTCDSDNMPIA